MWTSVASLSRLNYRLRSSSQLAPRDGFWMGNDSGRRRRSRSPRRLNPLKTQFYQPSRHPATTIPQSGGSLAFPGLALSATGRGLRIWSIFGRKTCNGEVIHARAQAFKTGCSTPGGHCRPAAHAQALWGKKAQRVSPLEPRRRAAGALAQLLDLHFTARRPPAFHSPLGDVGRGRSVLRHGARNAEIAEPDAESRRFRAPGIGR